MKILIKKKQQRLKRGKHETSMAKVNKISLNSNDHQRIQTFNCKNKKQKNPPKINHDNIIKKHT